MNDAATERTRVRRIPEKADYDRATVNEILDEALICHVGFVRTVCRTLSRRSTPGLGTPCTSMVPQRAGCCD